MNSLLNILLSIGLSLSGFMHRNPEAQKDISKPNIIILFADDFGYGDIACFGHPYAKTPNLDQLAKEGTMFMKFNVTGKTCHPSRCGLLTSRTPSSYPIPTVDHGFNQAQHGYVDRLTIMELLKGAGYTTGHFGKWHIGPDEEIIPGVYGIDEYKLLGGGGRDEFGRDQKIYDAAIDFIENNHEKTFYMNVMGRVTHSPVKPRPDLIELAGFGTIDEDDELHVEAFVDRDDFMGSQIQENFDIIESATDPENIKDAEEAGILGDINYSMANYLTEVYFLDQSIGRLLNKLDELGIADNTIVMFASDQGPAPVQFSTEDPEKINLIGYSGGLRGQKHDEHEGGVRVPCIMRWPGEIPAGKINTESTWSALDWLPTLCKITGVNIKLDEIHGEEVLDIWQGANRSRKHPQYWTSSMKVLDDEGEWRMYFANANDATVEELYNLSTDLMETDNLIDSRPEKVEEFQAMWIKWNENYQYDTTSISSPNLLWSPNKKPVTIYPNPTTDFIYFTTEKSAVQQVSIYDLCGHLVQQEKGEIKSINISSLLHGEYIVHITDEQGRISQQKILKY